jgi:hypothetical protein
MNTDDIYRKKSGLMLLGLFLVGILAMVIIPRYNLAFHVKKQDTQVAQSPSVSDLKKIGIDANSAEVLAAESESTGQTGQSGAGTCTPGRVCDTKVKLAEIPLCSTNDAGGDMTSGSAGKGRSFVSVRLNAKVEPFEITTPQVLIQGSKYIDDSRKIISYDYPVYRDSQNLILYDEARRTCAPGVDCKEFDDIAGITDNPFSVSSYVEVPGADEGGDGGKGRTVVYSVPSLKSACPKIQQAKANPRRSNQFSVLLDLRSQPPVLPGQHAVSRHFGAVQCLKTVPNGSELDEAETFKMCITDVKPTDFVVAAVYGIQQWLDCLIGKDSCRESKIFAIRIDPFFGGQMKCGKPECTIRYFEYKYLQNVAPGDAASQIPEEIDKAQVNVLQPVTESYYIATPCKIRINKWGIHDIPCIWDISPYQRQFDIQKAAYMPLDPTMPQTFDEYWEGGVLKELKKRSVSCI